MIVEKCVNMAAIMDKKVIGLVENMSYFQCPDCGKRHSVFGESHSEEIAARHGIEGVAKLPIDPALAKACDEGCIEDIEIDWLDELADVIEKL